MAQIVEERLVVKVSQLTKNGVETENKITKEIADALEQVVQELVGEGCVVEVTDE